MRYKLKDDAAVIGVSLLCKSWSHKIHERRPVWSPLTSAVHACGTEQAFACPCHHDRPLQSIDLLVSVQLEGLKLADGRRLKVVLCKPCMDVAALFYDLSRMLGMAQA